MTDTNKPDLDPGKQLDACLKTIYAAQENNKKKLILEVRRPADKAKMDSVKKLKTDLEDEGFTVSIRPPDIHCEIVITW